MLSSLHVWVNEMSFCVLLTVSLNSIYEFVSCFQFLKWVHLYSSLCSTNQVYWLFHWVLVPPAQNLTHVVMTMSESEGSSEAVRGWRMYHVTFLPRLWLSIYTAIPSPLFLLESSAIWLSAHFSHCLIIRFLLCMEKLSGEWYHCSNLHWEII